MIFPFENQKLPLTAIFAFIFSKLNEFDELPNFICVDCWMTVKKFHEFYQNVLNAQSRFLNGFNAIVKIETDNQYEEEISYADACK